MAKPAQCMANHARVDPKQPLSLCPCPVPAPGGAGAEASLEQLMLSNFVGNLCHIGDCRLSRNEAITPCVSCVSLSLLSNRNLSTIAGAFTKLAWLGLGWACTAWAVAGWAGWFRTSLAWNLICTHTLLIHTHTHSRKSLPGTIFLPSSPFQIYQQCSAWYFALTLSVWDAFTSPSRLPIVATQSKLSKLSSWLAI